MTALRQCLAITPCGHGVWLLTEMCSTRHSALYCQSYSSVRGVVLCASPTRKSHLRLRHWVSTSVSSQIHGCEHDYVRRLGMLRQCYCYHQALEAQCACRQGNLVDLFWERCKSHMVPTDAICVLQRSRLMRAPLTGVERTHPAEVTKHTTTCCRPFIYMHAEIASTTSSASASLATVFLTC